MTDIFDEANNTEVVYPLEDAMRDYVEAQAMEKKGKEMKDRAKPVILKHMEDNELDKQPTSMGVFSLGMRRSYTYSIPTIELAIRLEEIQKDEEAKGDIECKESNYVLFKADKESND